MTIDIRELARLDLNLLVTFQALFEDRHVTRAALRLGISQPALSHALKRLREQFSDDLFVKTPRGMIPTDRALALAPGVADCLDRVHQSVMGARSWDLKTSARIFRIQSTDLVESLLVPGLIERVNREAPQTALAFTTARFSFPREELETGQSDLAIGGFFGELPPGFYRQKVLVDEFEGAVRADHPRLKGKRRVSVTDLTQETHIMIAPGGELSGQLDRELEKLGTRRRLVAGLSTFVGAVAVAQQTDAVLVGPSKLFESLSDAFKLRTFALPVTMRPLQIVQVWHERNHRDPHHQWIRERVRQILG